MKGDAQSGVELRKDVAQTLRDMLPSLEERLAQKNENANVLRKRLRKRGAKPETFKALEAVGINSLKTLAQMNKDAEGEKRIQSAGVPDDQLNIVRCLMKQLESGMDDDDTTKKTTGADVATLVARMETLEDENRGLGEKLEFLDSKLKGMSENKTSTAIPASSKGGNTIMVDDRPANEYSVTPHNMGNTIHVDDSHQPAAEKPRMSAVMGGNTILVDDYQPNGYIKMQ